jgi:hypothetical protein
MRPETIRTNAYLIELRYLAWVKTQIDKHYLPIICPLIALLAPPPPQPKTHGTGDLENDKHS